MIELSFIDALMGGLRRKAILSPAQWAELYRRTPDGRPWDHTRCPWAYGMLNSKAIHNVGQKGAQLTYTENVLNIAMYRNDIFKSSVLYVLPTDRDANDFSHDRFDGCVKVSPHLSSLYDASNVGHKMAGPASIYIRGSGSRSGLKSVPVGMVVFDEVEEMDDWVIPLGIERVSGQVNKLIWEISTPKINNHGINQSFLESSQDHFFIRCPGCSRYIELTFPDCLEIIGEDPTDIRVHQSFLKCPKCSIKLPHEDKISWQKDNQWVSLVTDRDKKGFYINQMYSHTVTPGALAAAYLRGQTDPAALQEFWNSKMGLPYEPEGAQVTDQHLDNCTRGHLNDGKAQDPTKLITMGVDVGQAWNHYEICEWTLGDAIGDDVNTNAFPRLLQCGKVAQFEELDELMLQFRVHMCVVDVQPETRKAFEFSQRFYGHVKLCRYEVGLSGKQLQEKKAEAGYYVIAANRTSWLDQSMSRFKNQKIHLPKNLPFEYREHIKALARIWKHDKSGNPVAEYITRSKKADHHAHTRNYSEIALALASNIVHPYDGEDI